MIVIGGNLCKVMDCESGKLRAMCPNGLIEEVEAIRKQTRSGIDSKKQIKTIGKYEKCDVQKR